MSDNFAHAVVCEAASRGHRRDCSKNGKVRTLNLGLILTAFLKERYEAIQPKPDDLVFPSVKGKMIDDHNFLNRPWKKVLLSVGVEYRKTYAVRHTATTHMLERGVPPVIVAEQMGHDPQTLLKNYSHIIQSRSVFVEF